MFLSGISVAVFRLELIWLHKVNHSASLNVPRVRSGDGIPLRVQKDSARAYTIWSVNKLGDQMISLGYLRLLTRYLMYTLNGVPDGCVNVYRDFAFAWYIVTLRCLMRIPV